jgi:hypothetical protein
MKEILNCESVLRCQLFLVHTYENERIGGFSYFDYSRSVHLLGSFETLNSYQSRLRLAIPINTYQPAEGSQEHREHRVPMPASPQSQSIQSDCDA